MPRTRAQLEQAAADAEAWLDTIDPIELDKPRLMPPTCAASV